MTPGDANAQKHAQKVTSQVCIYSCVISENVPQRGMIMSGQWSSAKDALELAAFSAHVETHDRPTFVA